jgi:ribosomal protein L29
VDVGVLGLILAPAGREERVEELADRLADLSGELAALSVVCEAGPLSPAGAARS